MSRVIVLLLDSFGVGASLDASKFGDSGADTLGHIYESYYQQTQSILQLPYLFDLGLFHAHLSSTGKRLMGINYGHEPKAMFGYAVEQSFGKDTPSGHWEIAGVPVLFDWGYFSEQSSSFPKELITKLIRLGNLPGILGNCHASGTEIITKLGEEHIQTGKPIIYTSADSVFQIAAHEQYFGLERLYDLCYLARQLVNDYRVGRVIARPFIGEPGHFVRTSNRKDLSVLPPEPTLFDIAVQCNIDVVAIGKTADIFAHQGISREIKGKNNQELFDLTLKVIQEQRQEQLIFTNFVDFDSSYGHRRDSLGYAEALMQFDSRIPELFLQLKEDDLVIFTADHGCDPTFKGSDHTREHIPILAYSRSIKPKFIGRRDTFADIGQTIARWLAISPLKRGNAFIY